MSKLKGKPTSKLNSDQLNGIYKLIENNFNLIGESSEPTQIEQYLKLIKGCVDKLFAALSHSGSGDTGKEIRGTLIDALSKYQNAAVKKKDNLSIEKVILEKANQYLNQLENSNAINGVNSERVHKEAFL